MKYVIALATLIGLAITGPAAAADTEAGEAVYDKTCKSCHGNEGTGSNVADAFYKIQIPRLASKKVQMLTNPELKGIIKGGSGRMEPVRMGRPTAPHSKTKKLTDQQIDNVIAYVRSFWKEKSEQ